MPIDTSEQAFNAQENEIIPNGNDSNSLDSTWIYILELIQRLGLSTCLRYPTNMVTPTSYCAWGGQGVAKGWPIILINTTIHTLLYDWIRKNVNCSNEI